MPAESQLLGHVLLGLALGLPAGVAYFAALRRNVRMYVDGGFGGAAVGLHLLRLTVAVTLFVLLAKVGAGALLGGLSAFLLARAFALRGGRRTA